MKKCVIFDFDGTIADSFGAVSRIVDDMKKEEGKDVDFNDIRSLGILGFVKKARIPLWRLPGLTKRALSEMKDVDSLDMFSGMLGVLRALNKEYSLGIVSGSSEENILKFLKRHKAKELFDFVYSGSSLFGKARVLGKVCRERGIRKEDVIYVGDEDRDVVAARKFGVDVIGVCWGFNSEERLGEENPTYLARKPKDILDFVSRKFGLKGNKKL